MTSLLSKVPALLKQRTIQTLLVLITYVLLAPFLPTKAHEGFYTISLFIKDLLVWILPLTVGFFIAYTLVSFEKRAPLFVLSLIIFEFFSNFANVWYAFFSANLVMDHLPLSTASGLKGDFQALLRLPFIKPSWWSADKGSWLGLGLGFLAAFSKGAALKNFIKKGKEVFEWVLTRFFARLIPLFVLGFAANIYQTQLLDQVLAHYASLVGWLVLFLLSYIIFLFVVGAGLSLRNIFKNITSLLPAGGMAFTSGCSLSTMPWTIEGAAKTLKTSDLARAIIPATTNIQQVGDCIANAFLCCLIYKSFHGHGPDLLLWMKFSLVFVLARFATAAILGGAVFIMIPIYESYLGFNAEMVAIILALNVVLDPIITSCNVMGNGALARVFEKFFTWVLERLGKNFKKVNTEIKQSYGNR